MEVVLFMTEGKNERHAWFIFFLVAVFCAYEYSLRVMISPLTEQLSQKYLITPQTLGFFSSV